MNTLINDDQLYSEDLIDYWQRAADQLRWPFFYAFPEHCHDLQGRPLAVAVFRQLRVPRVAFPRSPLKKRRIKWKSNDQNKTLKWQFDLIFRL